MARARPPSPGPTMGILKLGHSGLGNLERNCAWQGRGGVFGFNMAIWFEAKDVLGLGY